MDVDPTTYTREDLQNLCVSVHALLMLEAYRYNEELDAAFEDEWTQVPRERLSPDPSSEDGEEDEVAREADNEGSEGSEEPEESSEGEIRVWVEDESEGEDVAQDIEDVELEGIAFRLSRIVIEDDSDNEEGELRALNEDEDQPQALNEEDQPQVLDEDQLHDRIQLQVSNGTDSQDNHGTEESEDEQW